MLLSQNQNKLFPCDMRIYMCTHLGAVSLPSVCFRCIVKLVFVMFCLVFFLIFSLLFFSFELHFGGWISEKLERSVANLAERSSPITIKYSAQH